MTDKQKLIKLLKAWSVPYHIYTLPKFINDKAVKLGAVESINVRGFVDFTFDKKGAIVGTCTYQINSFIKAKKLVATTALNRAIRESE